VCSGRTGGFFPVSTALTAIAASRQATADIRNVLRRKSISLFLFSLIGTATAQRYGNAATRGVTFWGRLGPIFVGAPEQGTPFSDCESGRSQRQTGRMHSTVRPTCDAGAGSRAHQARTRETACRASRGKRSGSNVAHARPASAAHRRSASCGTEARSAGCTSTRNPLSTHARWLGSNRGASSPSLISRVTKNRLKVKGER